jgi:predicted nuclease of predicted toxin-antitoxin system
MHPRHRTIRGLLSVKIKLDEALSKSMCECLVRHGYSAATVRQQGWNGLKDPALWPLIKGSNEFLIMSDKGFGDIRLYPPGTHPGILLLRPDKEST